MELKEVSLVFPHQLFENHPALEPGREVYLIEEWLYFRQYAFHKQKLVLQRASMKYYQRYLEDLGYKVHYIESMSKHSEIRQLVSLLAANGLKRVHLASVTDDWLSRRMRKALALHQMEEQEYLSPAFLNTMQEANTYFDGRKTYFQTDFYIDQRKKRNILVDAAQKPAGNQWSFDADNRAKFPKGAFAPALVFPVINDFVKEAREYVKQHFAENYGSLETPFGGPDSFYPVTHKEAASWLEDFLKQRLEKFGVYEDAIVAREKVLYHSVLSPLLNTGLLIPSQVVDRVLAYASRHDIPLNSVEGFIRQVIGWREYIRILYEREGRRQRTTNYFKFTRKIPPGFYTGTTGIVPVDNTIKRLLECGYTHHIERLMVMGNFMLLCEFDPDEVCRWFMELYIDAYDWVMVPNVYGMTQFADGGLMMTKPYISSSNYIKKMSDYKKGDWEGIWDALFWRFMQVHRSVFKRNPRLSMLLSTYDKMPADKKNALMDLAESFLKKL